MNFELKSVFLFVFSAMEIARMGRSASTMQWRCLDSQRKCLYVRIYLNITRRVYIWSGAEVEAIRKGAGGMFEIPLSLCMHPPFPMFVLKDIKTDVFLLSLASFPFCARPNVQ
jgi:hypothetical protein